MITVIATVQLRPGCRNAYLERLARLVPLVEAEAGCLGYRPHVDLDAGLPRQVTEPDQVIMVEQWRGLAELQAHLAARHMVAYREEVAPWVESVSIRVLAPA
jgi:quinol monooxygenase YgiN